MFSNRIMEFREMTPASVPEVETGTFAMVRGQSVGSSAQPWRKVRLSGGVPAQAKERGCRTQYWVSVKWLLELMKDAHPVDRRAL